MPLSCISSNFQKIECSALRTPLAPPRINTMPTNIKLPYAVVPHKKSQETANVVMTVKIALLGEHSVGSVHSTRAVHNKDKRAPDGKAPVSRYRAKSKQGERGGIYLVHAQPAVFQHTYMAVYKAGALSKNLAGLHTPTTYTNIHQMLVYRNLVLENRRVIH